MKATLSIRHAAKDAASNLRKAVVERLRVGFSV
jgi:hypothetical protein